MVEKLKEVVGKPRTDRYSSSRGIPGLRKAQAAYYGRRFGVKLNPDTQVVATLGSKEGFANVAQAISAPGDVVLCPNPSYPIHAFGFLMAGGVIRSVPAEGEREYFHALERAVIHSIPKPLAVVVCYPSNPTAHVADLDFYRDLVAFAKRHELIILSDLAYAEVYFDDKSAALGAAGSGRDGRDGRVHLDVEDLLDAGLAHGLCGRQRAHHRGARAREVVSRLRRVHADPGRGGRRAQRPGGVHHRDARDLQEAPRRAGRHASPAPASQCRRRAASMFAWAPVPEPFRALGSLEFSKLLVEKAEVAVSPGVAFGEHGEGYVRIALVENEQRIRQAARNIRRFLERGRGKLAQRRPPCDPALTRRASQRWATGALHGDAVESGACRSRHGRRVGRAADRPPARRADRPLRPSDRGRGGLRARSKSKDRGIDLKRLRWVADPVVLARDRGIDVFVELIGRRWRSGQAAIETALASGKSVVTANKALLAKHGVKLAALAERHHVALNFEAAVAGGIPIVKTLREGLVGNKLHRASTASSTAPAITS